MYVPVNALVDVYKPGKGISISGNVISVKLSVSLLEEAVLPSFDVLESMLPAVTKKPRRGRPYSLKDSAVL